MEDKKTVLIMANFKAECSGNFINSLIELVERSKETYNYLFMFPMCDDGKERSWVDYIRRHGYKVIIFDESRDSEECAKMLHQIVDENHVDLIHNHFSMLNNIVLWDRKLHSKVKILYHDHMDFVPEIPITEQYKKQFKISKRYKQYGIGVINVMKRKYRSYIFTPKKWYIPNGITFKRNIVNSLSREETRTKLELKADEKLCLFLGWDFYRKGLDIAIKSVMLLRQQGHNVSLGVLGFGANPSKEHVAKIQNVLGFDPRQDGIKFLDSWEDMFALHRAADVFLSCSRKEAFAYAILEAISQNVPVVASNISGTRWCLKYNKAFKYPTENYNKCAKAILKAIELRDSDSNREELVNRYNINIWCDRILSVYRKMLS